MFVDVVVMMKTGGGGRVLRKWLQLR